MDFPNALRCFAYFTVSSSAPCAKPTACAAIPMRPPSSALKAIFNPCPSSPRRFSAGTTQSFSKISTDGEDRCPILSSCRPTRNPENPGSTRNALRPFPPPSGSAFAKTSNTLATLPLETQVLVSVDFEAFPAAPRPARMPRRIRPRRRFRQAKRAKSFPCGHTPQIFFLLRLVAEHQERRLHRGTCHANCRGQRREHARYFLHDQCIGNRVEPRPAPLSGNQHSATAHLTELADRFRRKFFRLLHLLDERAHLRLHELADGIANQFLVVVKRKIHRVVGRFAAAIKTARGVRTMLTWPAGKQKAAGTGW